MTLNLDKSGQKPIRHVLSDLHLEFAPLELKSSGDILVLAGDILVADYLRRGEASPYTKKIVPNYNAFLEQARSNYNHVIMIAGNHEHYHGDLSNTADIIRACYPWLHYLDDEYVDLVGTRYFGGTMWTNFNCGSPMAMMYAENGLNDFRLIKNMYKRARPSVILGKHRDFMRALDNAYKPGMVVISHHAPSFQSVAEKYVGDPLNDAYASDYHDYIASKSISVWLHGHVHHSNDYVINNTRIISNPRGYHDENPNFRQGLLF